MKTNLRLGEMILSDDEIIGIKNYADLIGKLRLIAKDCRWQLLEDAADTIDELRRDAARYRWLKENIRGGSFGTSIGWFTDDISEWDEDIDAAIKESK